MEALHHTSIGQNLEELERCLPLVGDRLGVVESSLEISRVEMDQYLTGVDILVVGHEYLRNEPRDMRGYGRDVTAGIGVVGALDKAADGPPVAAVGDAAQGDSERKAGERQMLQSEF